MLPQKAILLLMELKLIGKRVVIVHTIAVRWTASAPTATFGRLARTPIRTVASCTSIRASCTRSTASAALTGSPCAPSQNKIRFI